MVRTTSAMGWPATVTGVTTTSMLSSLDTRMTHGHGADGAVTIREPRVGVPSLLISRACEPRLSQSTEPRSASLPQMAMITTSGLEAGHRHADPLADLDVGPVGDDGRPVRDALSAAGLRQRKYTDDPANTTSNGDGSSGSRRLVYGFAVGDDVNSRGAVLAVGVSVATVRPQCEQPEDQGEQCQDDDDGNRERHRLAA